MVKRSDARVPLADLISNETALFDAIEVRHCIARSDVLRAQLKAIIEGNVSRWVRPPKQRDINESVKKAQQLLRAIQMLKGFGDLLTQSHHLSYKGPPADEAKLHSSQLGHAIYRSGVIIDRSPFMWAKDRWPNFQDDLLRVIQEWATPQPHDARKYPKRDPNETLLVQLLAVVLRAAGAKIPTMKSGEPTLFQETCYAILLRAGHVHCSHTGAKQRLEPETQAAFYERVLRLLRDKSVRAKIDAIAALAHASSDQLDRIESDLSIYADLLWLPQRLWPGQ